MHKKTKDMAKRIPALAIVELLNETTKTKGNLTAKATAHKPVVETAFIGVEFLVRKVEFEDSITNTVFGSEVLGRRITVKIRLDCYIECRVSMASIKAVRHDEYDDTVIVILPKPELLGRVPENHEYDYEEDYGNLRAKWIDSEEARSIRKDMVSKAGRKAAEEFRKGEEMVEFRKGFKRELRAHLKTSSLTPNLRIEVKFEDE